MSGMFGPYLRVLRHPGAARFSAAAAFARLQMSMTGVGAVLLISAVRGSYGLAGLIAAVYAVSAALIAPQILRLTDALGQRRVLPLQLLVHVPVTLLMIFFGVYTELNWPILLLAVVAGGTQPSIGSLVRARWSKQLSGTPQLRTAFAWESLIDEVCFIVGPPLATVLALQLFPSAALIFGLVAVTVGGLALARQVGTQPTPTGAVRQTGGRPAILLPGVAGIFAVMVLLGGVFGSLEVTTVAVTKAEGQPGMAGLLLALYSFGSLVSGLVFGALNLQISLRRQLLFAVGGLAVVSAPLAVLPSLWATAVGLFLAGLAVAPSLISGMALIERIVPASRLSESMGWASSGIGLGLALSMPAAGYVSDHVPPHLAYLVLSGCAVGALLVALGVLPGLRRAEKSALATDSDQPGVTAVPAEPMVVIDAPVPMPPLEEPGQPGTAAAERW